MSGEESAAAVRIPTEKLIDFKNEANRKVPAARFYEDISELVEGKLELVPPTLKAYDEIHKKYQMLTQSLNQQLTLLEERQKNLKEALDVIESAKTRASGSQVLYKVSDCLYTRARITEPQRCLLWLGSNTMIDYSPEEAEEVIKTNLNTTEDSIETVTDNILSLRAETTVIEAGMSRLHNFGVHLRSERAAAAAASLG